MSVTRGALQHFLDLPEQPQHWVSLRIFSVYRLIVSLSLLLLFVPGQGDRLGHTDPLLFLGAILGYLLLACLWLLLSILHKPDFTLQVFAQVYLDIVFITLLMHASGGVSSGLGMLMIISIAGMGLIMTGRYTLLFASIAATFVLSQQLYAQQMALVATQNTTQAGILGFSLLITAYVARQLAQRSIQSEALARSRGKALADISKLNEVILESTRSGLVLINQDFQINKINQAARKLLAYEGEIPETLQQVSSRLEAVVKQWWKKSLQDVSVLPAQSGWDDLRIGIYHIHPVSGKNNDHNILISLDDVSDMNRYLQQSKLAALGQLTASIAHEVRNPLSAIRHAAQLLGETPELNEQDKRLTEIMQQHADRINDMVESILQLSRRDQHNAVPIPLLEFLQNFKREVCITYQPRTASCEIDVQGSNLQITADPAHLGQLLHNLCDNAYRHGGEQVEVYLKAYKNTEDGKIIMEVIDNGKPIPDSVKAHMFEPFYTTSSRGTGLGLYLANTLCEVNHARLAHFSHEGGGNCFRIIFSDESTV